MKRAFARTAVAAIPLVANIALAAVPSTTPPAPGRYAGCEVLSYSASTGAVGRVVPNAPSGGVGTRRTTAARLGASTSSGSAAETSSETWVVRSAADAGRTVAVRQARLASGGISMCAYSPNRVLATLAAGKSYATFVQEMTAKGLHVVRELMRDLDGNAVYVIEAKETENDIVEQMTMSIEETGSCTMVRPDSIYEANAVPNDPGYIYQWGLEKIGAPQAWDTRTDASSVLVAVLDTGVNYNHRDLLRNLWLNDGEIPGDGIDNDANGIVDDVFGMSCVGGNVSGNPMDDNGHGSHCAGIVGADGGNRAFVSGVAWKAKVMALKFLDSEGNGFVSDAVTCLRYAEDHGVKIVNCSFGQSGTFDDYLYIQMKKMSQQGTIFACAAGNAKAGESPRDNDEFPFYPCNYSVDTIVSVAATDQNDALANFSYYGALNVDIAAPGVDIYSTLLDSSLGYKSGTSMATPHVTGALALLMAHYPGDLPAQIIDRLYAAAEPVPALAGKVRTGARLSMAGFFGIAPPTEISVSQGTVNDAVVIYWTAVNGGTHYRVWRSAEEGGERTMLSDWRQALTYSDETAEPGVTYWYYLQAASSADGAKASTFSQGESGFCPVIDTSRITVLFDPAGGTVSPASKVYRIGETYAELPMPAYSGKAFLGWFTAASGGTRLDEPSLVRADATTLYAQWTASDALRIENLFARQRYPWNGYVDVTFDLFGVPNDETASVSLTAQEEGGNSPLALRTFVGPAPTNLVNGAQHVVWNATPDTQGILYTNLILAATVAIDEKPLLPPKNVSASNGTDADAVVVTWSASDNATSYEVWRATANNSASASKVASPTTTSYRDTSAVPATAYWYWVRAVNAKKASEFSASASGSRKKIVTGIAISGPESVTAGESATYTCTAIYNDDTTVTVTPEWRITDLLPYASISDTGVLTASYSSVEEYASIQASYSTNDSTYTTTMFVTINTKTVTVFFNGNGGTASQTSKSCIAFGTYGTLPDATRSGYTFAGWWTQATGGSRVTASSTVPVETSTLWAHWTANTYTIRFNANGGTGTMADLAMTYETATKLPNNAFTRTDYAFVGWATSADGNVVYADGASVNSLTATQDEVVNLYAKWTAFSTALDTSAMTFTTGGDASWEVAADKSYSGSSSARSGDITDSQSSWLQTEVSGAGTISFWYKVSSEDNWNNLTFYVDGTQKMVASGTGSDWERFECAVTDDAQHILKWVYAKDSSVSISYDCCWIDAVTWTSDNPLLSSRYDLRTLGRVTSVKSQGAYSACWAFDVLGSLESTLLSETGIVYDLSENNMLNLAGFDYGFGDGGNVAMAQAYLLRWDGPVLESQDAYPSIGTSVKTSPAVHVQNVIYIFPKVSALDNARIKRAIVEDGGVYASYHWDYSGYNSAAYAYCLPSYSGNSSFTGLIVGWDDNYSKANFITPPAGDGAYIVKTCWGTTFGESGYVYVSYYDATMAYDTMYVFKGDPTSNYTRNYQYDPFGMIRSINATRAANMFKAEANEDIAAVGVYVLGTNATYTIDVYAGCTAGDPVSGTKRATKTITFEDAGYYTVPLDSAVPVSAGSMFSVVVFMNVPGYSYPMAIEYSDSGYSSAAMAESGQSFYSNDGVTWRDLTTVSWASTANFCCKAYAKPSQTVELTFDANGGTVSPVSTVMNVGVTYGFLPEPSRTGYTFAGWWTAASGGSRITESSIVPAASITLYAHWTALTSTITLNAQGGSGGTSSVTATYGSAMRSITVPTRSGYTFGGYYTSTGGGGTQYYTASGASARAWDKTSATTLYAKWTANSYVLSVNPNGGTLVGSNFGTAEGTGQQTSVNVTYDALYYYELGTATRSGYTFDGWWTSATGGEKVYNANGLAVTGSRYWNASWQWQYLGNLTIYAHWLGVSNTVTLNKQSGSGGTSSVTATYGSSMPSITVPTRSGYTFGGYYTGTNGSGTQYYTASGASARTWDKTSATMLYAKWTSNVPSAPTGVSLKLSGVVPAVIGGGTIISSGFFLSWNAVAGATEYEVWYNTTSSTSTASQLTQGIFSSDTSYRWTSGYWRDQTYYFWVKAKNASGTSGFSSRVSGKL